MQQLKIGSIPSALVDDGIFELLTSCRTVRNGRALAVTATHVAGMFSDLIGASDTRKIAAKLPEINVLISLVQFNCSGSIVIVQAITLGYILHIFSRPFFLVF